MDPAETPPATSCVDPTEDEEYQRFVESMAEHCRCTPEFMRPCDGLLAGGLCDDLHFEEDGEDDDSPEERYDREVFGDETHTPMSL